jgi:hypothetical protein
MTGYEEQLLTRAEMLEDTDELAGAITAILAGAQRAGVDPAAVTSLAGAGRALDPGAAASYDAGSKEDRRPGGGYDSDAAMLEAVSEAEHDLAGHAREVSQLQEHTATAMDAAQGALEAAYAMPVKDECDGCHGFREAAIANALARIESCETAIDILDPLAGRLAAALEKLRQVPQDLGEVYELVYAFVCSGGKLPRYARWIEGEETLT